MKNLATRLGDWRANGVAKVDADIVESVRRIDEAITHEGLTVRWQWVRAHNGNGGNVRADALEARRAVTSSIRARETCHPARATVHSSR